MPVKFPLEHVYESQQFDSWVLDLVFETADAMKADHIFRTLMGEEVPPRKAFIQAHAKSVRNLDI